MLSAIAQPSSTLHDQQEVSASATLLIFVPMVSTASDRPRNRGQLLWMSEINRETASENRATNREDRLRKCGTDRLPRAIPQTILLFSVCPERALCRLGGNLCTLKDSSHATHVFAGETLGETIKRDGETQMMSYLAINGS
ncbi:hypothetical protein PROFUN_08633 [Planoprotostelium fungivorum]|uniref:Uncharacterized protein n=1 Tax=Planoprotostelium fungivorum TaxID=1890364 RepID=A0A2P6NJ43_9EUKA|nr:hypothetical protein PROFUN_08633 [Planoprotostelium fungivorum]